MPRQGRQAAGRPPHRFRGRLPEPATIPLEALPDTMRLDTVAVAAYSGRSIGSVDVRRARKSDGLRWERAGSRSPPFCKAGDLKNALASPTRDPVNRTPTVPADRARERDLKEPARASRRAPNGAVVRKRHRTKGVTSRRRRTRSQGRPLRP